jgi:hypothetical protein
MSRTRSVLSRMKPIRHAIGSLPNVTAPSLRRPWGLPMKSKPQKPKSSGKPAREPEKPVLSLQEKVEQDQADTVKWNQIAAYPGLSQPAALFAKNMARSSQAALTLSQKALAYQAGQLPEKEQQEALDAHLAAVLRLPPSLLEPSPSLQPPANPPTSTAPET